MAAFSDLKSSNTFGVYDVNFYEHRIETTVTNAAAVVDRWIAEVVRIHRHKFGNLIGLDIEWYHIEQNVHILQLCIGRRCLVFQIHHATVIPQSLAWFLGNPKFTFVGVGIKDDVEKLNKYHGLRVACIMDLHTVAASKFPDMNMHRLGLKAMARELLKKDMKKPQRVTFSRWDDRFLSAEQIEYACIDAFVSFNLGMLLSLA